MSQRPQDDFRLACYLSDRKTGRLYVIRRQDGRLHCRPLPQGPATGLPPEARPVLVGVDEDDRVVLWDPRGETLTHQEALPADAFAAHCYRDPYSDRAWFMNDGDKEHGNDRLHCGEAGSSVTGMAAIDSRRARYLKTVCLGRGHHQAEFTGPCARRPTMPRRLWVSSLKDGTLDVVGNDPEGDDDLTLLARIDLREPERETDEGNHAYPHGTAYSPHTGRVYNLNNGYGNVVEIDPETLEITRRADFPGHSNLFAVPGGRWLIGRGADRKSDPEHCLARLSVLDPEHLETRASRILPDVYLSKYFFDPAGRRLYMSCGRSGNEAQQAHLRPGVLLVFDLQALPELPPPQELDLGAPVGTLDFLPGGLMAASVGERGVVALVDPERLEVVEEVALGESQPHSRLWTLPLA